MEDKIEATNGSRFHACMCKLCFPKWLISREEESEET